MDVQQSQSTFVYPPLESRRHIRLIQVVEPEESESVTRISFLTTSLDAPCRYQTLSYTWGSIHADGSHLTNTVSCDGKQLCITSSLHSFFERLRGKRKNGEAVRLPLWIDAISINQDDAGERAQQVAMMASIYRYSSQLIIWLGELDIDRSLGFPFDQAEQDEPEQSDMIPIVASSMGDYEWERALSSRNSAESHKLREILKLNWFNRHWVIQEMLHTPVTSRIVWVGNREMAWSSLREAVHLANLEHLAGPVIRLLLDEEFMDNDIDDRRILGSSDENAMKDNSSVSSLLLLQNLEICSDAECGDDRDRVYALLSVSSDGQNFGVDYTCDTEAVYRHVAKRYLGYSWSYVIRVLVFATVHLGRGRTTTFLPSWVPDWRNPISFVSREHEECFKECSSGVFPVRIGDKRRRRLGASVHGNRLYIRAWLFSSYQGTHVSSIGSCNACREHAENDFEQHGQVGSSEGNEITSSYRYCLACRFPELEQLNAFRTDRERPLISTDQTLCLLDGSLVAFVLSPYKKAEQTGTPIYILESCLLVNSVWNDGACKAILGESTTIAIR